VEEYLVKLEAYYNIGETINIDKTCKNITNASNNEPVPRHSLVVYNTYLAAFRNQIFNEYKYVIVRKSLHTYISIYHTYISIYHTYLSYNIHIS